MRPTTLVSFTACALLAGCAMRGPEPKQSNRDAPLPDPGPDYVYSPNIQRAMPPPAVRSIPLALEGPFSDCGLVEPHFAFDASTAQPQADPALRELANCLNSWPHEDIQVRVVGRADAIGTTAYNKDLSYRRATYVRDKLVQFGVDADRIEVASRGEADAKAQSRPDYSFGSDRRADVVYVRAVVPTRR